MANLVIRPHVSGVPWYDFSLTTGLIECGRVAVLQDFCNEIARHSVANGVAPDATGQV